MARRGIDPSSLEDQVAAVEERGKELMEQVKEDLRTGKQQRSRAGQGHDRDEATHIRVMMMRKRARQRFLCRKYHIFCSGQDQCRSNLDCLSRSVELYRQNERLAVPDLGDRINRPQVLGKDEDDEGSVDDEVVSLSTTTSFEFLETSDARGREEDVKSLGSSFVADSEEMAEEEEEEDKSAADEGVLEGAVARDEKGEDEERKVVDFDRVFTVSFRLVEGFFFHNPSKLIHSRIPYSCPRNPALSPTARATRWPCNRRRRRRGRRRRRQTPA